MSTTGVPDLSQMMSQVEAAQPGKPLPPVDEWNPPNCGEIDIRIARDGRWYHDGSPIGREPLVRLFSTILRHDPDGYYLVTPVEKLKITVEDAPFIAVRVDRVDGVLRFTTNLGDTTDVGPDHPLRVTVDPKTGEPAPYVHVRGGLLARLARPVFYELVEMGEVKDTPAGPQVGVESGGAWFTLGKIDPTRL
jgi:hypothetical protein